MGLRHVRRMHLEAVIESSAHETIPAFPSLVLDPKCSCRAHIGRGLCQGAQPLPSAWFWWQSFMCHHTYFPVKIQKSLPLWEELNSLALQCLCLSFLWYQGTEMRDFLNTCLSLGRRGLCHGSINLISFPPQNWGCTTSLRKQNAFLPFPLPTGPCWLWRKCLSCADFTAASGRAQ